MRRPARISLQPPPSLLLAACLGLTLIACTERDSRWDEYPQVEGPIIAGDALAWLNSSMDLAITLRPGETPTCHSILENGRSLAPAADSLVLLGKGEGSTYLQRLSLDGSPSSRIALRAAFSRLAVTEDGRTAVAFHDLEAGPSPGSAAARNLGEIALIDLELDIATQLLLQTGAAAPTEVLFSADGGLAAVLFERAVALVDVRLPAEALTIPLKLPNGQVLRIQESILEPGGELLFLRTAELDEVLVVSIDRGDDGLGASINFLGPGGGTKLRSIALPEGVGFERKVVALYDDRATLFDADGDTSLDVSIFFSGRPTRILILEDGLVLLHGEPSQRGESTSVVAWDLRSGRIAQDRLEGPLIGLPYLVGDKSFFSHSVDGHPVISAAAVEREELRLRLRLQPIGLSGFPTGFAAGSAEAKLFTSLNIPRDESGAAPRPGSNQGSTGAIITLRTDDLAIDHLVLDEVIVELGAVGDHLFALHPADLGDVSFVPMTRLTRSAAFRYEYILTSGLMGCE